ncbi:MAG TPA: EscU/YscU/HrcU family type III secretion system export apparatus switch protein, partial [Candidatus Angelobacter sp.]|nr:EscU/YscU/HrcU family type III secretion system export apparatus switch protein [Candidatus Angelobacter sp.]
MADSSKTEKPTPRRRQKAREQGQVARSRELMTGVATMTAVLVVSAQAPHFAGAWRGLFGRALDSAATRSGSANALPMLYW